MKFRREGSSIIATVKARNELDAWNRVLHAADKSKAPSFYEMRVVQVAPANDAGNATYDCRMLVGRDDPWIEANMPEIYA